MDEQWWYCMKHRTVEGGAGCSNTDRMGPYASRDEAAAAIDNAAQRTQAWETDPRWNDDVEER
jgi:hypothetical protein